jgi:hypothetical protein
MEAAARSFMFDTDGHALEVEEGEQEQQEEQCVVQEVV